MRRRRGLGKFVSKMRRSTNRGGVVFSSACRHPEISPNRSSFLLVMFAIGFVSQSYFPNIGSAAGRLMQPWKFVPSIGTLKILEVTPGDTEVLLGESLEVAAEIVDRLEGDPYSATLYVTFDGDEEIDLPMTPGEPYTTRAIRDNVALDEARRRYTLTLPTVKSPMTYRLEIGDSQTRLYKVDVIEKPTVDEIEVTLKYPVYLGRADESFLQKTADLEVPQYTIAELHIRPSVPITKGRIDAEGVIFNGELQSDGRLMVVRMPLVKNTTFSIHLEKNGQFDPNPRLNRVQVLPDRPPTIELLKPPRQSSAAPGSDLPVMIRGADDHGVGRVRLEMKAEADSGKRTDGEASTIADRQTTVVKEWTEFDSNSAIVLHHLVAMAADLAKPGEVRAASRHGPGSTHVQRVRLGPETAGSRHRLAYRSYRGRTGQGRRGSREAR